MKNNLSEEDSMDERVGGEDKGTGSELGGSVGGSGVVCSVVSSGGISGVGCG